MPSHFDAEPMAVLFSYDPETGEHTADPLVGLHPSSGLDPISWALALRDSIAGDFPATRLWTVTGNDEAKELRRQGLIDAILKPRTPGSPLGAL